MVCSPRVIYSCTFSAYPALSCIESDFSCPSFVVACVMRAFLLRLEAVSIYTTRITPCSICDEDATAQARLRNHDALIGICSHWISSSKPFAPQTPHSTSPSSVAIELYSTNFIRSGSFGNLWGEPTARM